MGLTRSTWWFSLLLAFASACSATAADLPAGVTEEQMAVVTHDRLVLNAVLTRPLADATAARTGIVLLHGSGATDMDQTVGPEITATGRTEKPLRALAWRLAREGFVVLRYNKRGVDVDPRQNDPQVLETATLFDLVSDARAAVQLLRSTGRVPPNRIVLVGHSEGSVIGSLVAERDSGIAGLACLAPLARNLRDILHFQLVTRVVDWTWKLVDANGDGRLTPDEIAAAPRYRIPLDRLDADGDGAIGSFELERGLESAWERFAATQAQASPWMHDHFALEANLTRFARLTIPVQLFHGEADAQTPLAESQLLARALAGRACGPATLDTFPGLGHGFSPPLAADRPTVGPIEESALERIVARLASVYGARELSLKSE